MNDVTCNVMESIRYRPGEAIRWLSTGATDLKAQAKRQGESVIARKGERNIGKDIKEAAGAILDMGKGTWAELLHRQAESSEYVLFDDRFEIVTPGVIKTIKYEDVDSIHQKADRVSIILKQGSVTIKPYAHIVAGKLKVPVGWSRNGLEVPYETLIDELSARCRVNIAYL